MKRKSIDFIRDITDTINDIEIFVKGFDFDMFCDDRKTVYAVIRAVEIIGEAVKNIPDAIRKDNPGIPWKQIAGMRDKLIHGYFGVDNIILWKAATEELPQLKPLFSEILEIETIRKNTTAQNDKKSRIPGTPYLISQQNNNKVSPEFHDSNQKPATGNQ